MRVIHVGRLVDAIFSEEPALPSTVDGIDQIHWDSTVSGSVFEIRAGSRNYVAHVTAEARGHLVRARDNIIRLAALEETGIPRVIAWRDSGAAPSRGNEWAILI